jgi:predicted phage terminase large subunit-like protein
MTSLQNSSPIDLPPWSPKIYKMFNTWQRDRQMAGLLLHASEHAEEIREKCKSFRGFVEEAWGVLEPGTKFVPGWHIDAICDHLEAITWGGIDPRLIINVPPGSMKSLLVSVMWQAWEWGPCGMPHHRFLSTSFEQETATRDSRKTRDLVQSEWYKMLWPEIILKRAGEGSFENTKTGSREAVAFASLTGKRGDRLTIDDPHSVSQAESETDRKKATRLFIEGGQNRLNDQMKSAIVIIMQRVHEADLSGVLLAEDMGYVHLCIPMEFDEKRRCITPIWEDPRTFDGELMNEARMPEAALKPLRISEYSYAGQYQQTPGPRKGGFFKPDMIEIVDAIPAGVTKWARGWDLAATTDGDWTVGLLMGQMKDGRYVIADVKRERFTSDMRDALIKNTASQDGKGVEISIPREPAAAGKTLGIWHARLLAGYKVEVSPETGSKEDRADPYSSQVNVGNVVMLRGHWNKVLIEEMRNFPKGRYDDQVDAGSRAFKKLVFGIPKAFIARPQTFSIPNVSPGG